MQYLALDRVAKAVVAGLTAAYGIYEFATMSESAGGVDVVGDEWVRVAVFGLLALVGTWAVPNKQDPQPEPPQVVAQAVVPVQAVEAAPAGDPVPAGGLAPTELRY